METKRGRNIFNTINQIFFQKNGVKMKRLFALSLTSILLIFTACQNEGPITGPQLSGNQKSSGSQKISKATPNWIGLPANADKKLLKTFSTSQFISIADGGQLTIDETYTSTEGNVVHAYSSIVLAPGCVQQDVNISMSIDDQTGVSTFLPHQMFNFPAILNQTFTGLNLSGVDVNNIHLYYLDTDGSYEVMQCDQLTVDAATGTITVVNGKIPHFSVYGFGI
jgi:hypothetical protein